VEYLEPQLFTTAMAPLPEAPSAPAAIVERVHENRTGMTTKTLT